MTVTDVKVEKLVVIDVSVEMVGAVIVEMGENGRLWVAVVVSSCTRPADVESGASMLAAGCCLFLSVSF